MGPLFCLSPCRRLPSLRCDSHRREASRWWSPIRRSAPKRPPRMGLLSVVRLIASVTCRLARRQPRHARPRTTRAPRQTSSRASSRTVLVARPFSSHYILTSSSRHVSLRPRQQRGARRWRGHRIRASSYAAAPRSRVRDRGSGDGLTYCCRLKIQKKTTSSGSLL